ncbi:MAG: T9SS type A sorting domain-containing protein [Saprospiraceae bacterium]
MKVLNSGKALVLAALAVFSLNFAYAQPANDACANAIALSCGQTVTGNTATATNDVAPLCSGIAPQGKGVWYTITGTGGTITLSTCSTATLFDTQISVYTGACTALSCVAANNNDAACSQSGAYPAGRKSTVTFNSVFGTVYRVLVAGTVSSNGAFSLSVTCGIAGPPNDDCSNSILVACGSTTTGSTVGAAADAVGSCGGTALNTAGGVWYRVVGNGGMVTVSLCGSSYDTKVGVFSGTCGALVCVAGNDDFCGTSGLQSQVTFSSAAGTTYLILVTGFSSNTGSFTMNVTCVAPPCNCTNTTSFGTATAGTSNSPVTISTCNFPAEFATINNAVAGSSYTFTSSVGTDFLTVRQGTSGGAALGCGTTPLTVTATANGPLFLHISLSSACNTLASGCRTTTVTCSSCSGPNGGAACAAATPLACGGSVSGTTVGGTTNTGLGTCVTALNSAPGAWHTFTSPTSQVVTLSTCNATGFDTKLGVFGGTCGNLSCITGNDDATCTFSGLRSTVTFTATGGVTYLIYVTGFGTATGAYVLSATCVSTLVGQDNELAEAFETQTVSNELNVGELFPNPVANTNVSVKINSPEEAIARVNVFDNMGRAVRTMETELYSGANTVELNLDQLATGTYFVSIQVGKETVRRKLLIMRP